ncbi:DNA-binding CsgD family transcriptional regulator [Kibdelosporangium banguiense]|uniref:DNA-binding CsgD family transcriptional regulator n=1 Tax=Kibdelosporangium banguiense TaxID=1365924 RepID=A0ABS4T632_9PSEU|nr:LuxR family transcriptional regulator [Kibdelosporangium banguiense]MBP2319921.1 DNA-binding CsgD family transcriptional regulator [Kibdelosporangium banguiense]
MWSRSPLVIGRDREVAELTRAIAAARASRGGAVFLVGEPGIGKSRLAAEAAGIAFAAGVRVLRGRGSTIGPIVPFRPLTEALLSLYRTGSPPDDPALGPYRAILGRLIPDLQQDAQPSVGDSLVVLGEAVLRLLTVSGRDGGCLLVLEDLQHADAETLAIVEYLTDNLADLPILLLGTSRDEQCAALDLARSAAQRRSASVVRLDRLAHVDIALFAASCLETTTEELPAEITGRLAEYSAGIPFVLEELLHQLVHDGVITRGIDGWRVTGEIRAEVPETVTRGVINRAEQLGPQGSMLISVAAVLGDRFPLSVVGRVTDLDDRTMLAHLRAGVAAQLVIPDEASPDWYAFRHPLTAEALRSALNPADRAEYSRRAVEAVQELHPGLPGEWCQLVATMQLDAGETVSAVGLFAEAGRRALADGAAGSAVMLLDRANKLAADTSAEVKAEVLEALLYALAEAGELERARALVNTLDELGGQGLGPVQRSALHCRLAWVAYLAGQGGEGMNQLQAARAALGPDAREEHIAPIDAIDANITFYSGHDQGAAAERLARRALQAAERAGLPMVACDSLQILGVIVRERDLAESSTYLERARSLAEQHRSPILRVYALVRLAGNHWLSTADPTLLEQAAEEARRVGAVSVGYNIDANLAIHTVLSGDFASAVPMIERCQRDVVRLKLTPLVRYMLMVEATLAAHQGKRTDMEQILAEFVRWDGEQSQEMPLVLGFSRTFCALLDEDRSSARGELRNLLDLVSDLPPMFHLAGQHGMNLLLSVLDGDAGWPDYERVAATVPSKMRWNRQFVEWSRAILLGRDGDTEGAMAAAESALDSASAYDMACHLGQRLVAEAAIEDGWGDPVAWLRTAEEYFHQLSVPPVASACRSLLRQIGAPVKQRRHGMDQVPDDLRAIGVTVREHEVLQLLVDRLTNKAIANRLHISPRTVEKHVASLILKAEVADRVELSNFAASAYSQSG